MCYEATPKSLNSTITLKIVIVTTEILSLNPLFPFVLSSPIYISFDISLFVFRYSSATIGAQKGYLIR